MCLACQIGAYAECFMLNGVRCNTKTQVVEAPKGKVKIKGDPSHDKKPKGASPKLKPDDDVRDAKSTGRKRAAVLLPLTKADGTKVKCEWAGLKFAGGGKNPIVGCTGNPATNRHHGPDKNTLNNSRENPRNIHAICAWCHNRWHAANDIGYEAYVEEVGGPEKLPAHDMETQATADELVVANRSQYERRK